MEISQREEEVRYLIDQAFTVTPRMTLGMLQSILTSRVTCAERDKILTKMVNEGIISTENVILTSFRGATSVHKVITRLRTN